MTNDSYHSMAGDATCNNCFEKATVECRDSDEYVSVLGSVHAEAIHRKRAVGSTTAATWLKYLSSAACPPLGSPLVFPTIYQTDGAVAAPLQPLFLLAILIFVLVGLYRIFVLFRKRSKSCHPCEPFLAPSRQMLAQWIVKAWAKVPKELVRKSWEYCGYKSTEDLSNE